MSSGKLDELTLDRPALIDWLRSEQLAGNAPMICLVPRDVRAVGIDEPGHDGEHGHV